VVRECRLLAERQLHCGGRASSRMTTHSWMWTASVAERVRSLSWQCRQKIVITRNDGARLTKERAQLTNDEVSVG
jgi:hypothetical protein